MKQERHKVRNAANPSWFGESIHYWPPDALALARAMALVETVAVNSIEAGKIYLKIFDIWRKPEINAVYEEIISEVPDSIQEEWRRNLTHPELTIKDGVNKPFVDYNNLVNEPGLQNLLPQVAEQLMATPFAKSENLNDLAELFTLILEFIIVGFNRITDIEKGKYRVLPSNNPPWLNLALMYRTAFDSHQITLDRLRKIYKVKKVKGKLIDFEDVLANQPNSRMHRWMVSGGKEAGMKLKHDDVFMESAWRWYQCRIECKSIEDFCNKMVEEILLDPKNVHSEIRPFDEAIGYGKYAKQ